MTARLPCPIGEAKARAYEAVAKVHFQDCYSRTDIGQKAIDRGPWVGGSVPC